MPPPMAKRATKTSTGMKIIRRIMIAHSFDFFVHISLLIPAGVDSSARFAYIHRVADQSTVRAMKSGLRTVSDADQRGFSFDCSRFGFVSGCGLLELRSGACQHFPFALQ